MVFKKFVGRRQAMIALMIGVYSSSPPHTVPHLSHHPLPFPLLAHAAQRAKDSAHHGMLLTFKFLQEATEGHGI
jgi:hypothetical protein